jgi:hypothetical protein
VPDEPGDASPVPDEPGDPRPLPDELGDPRPLPEELGIPRLPVDDPVAGSVDGAGEPGVVTGELPFGVGTTPAPPFGP